jgi:PAS domain S-box-containing protein
VAWQGGPLGQLADALETRRDDILRRWEERARALGATQGALGDQLPEELAALGALLRGAPEAGPSRRWRPGFELDALVREYDLLRELLLDFIEEEGLPATLGEVRRITRFVASAIAEAVGAHAREQERQRQFAELGRTRLDALFMQAPVAIAVIRGPQLVIDLANPLMCRLWGRPRERVVGRPLLEAMPELVGQPFEDLLHQVMETGEAFVGREMPARLVRQEGEELAESYFNLVYEPLRDASGVIEGVLNVATEVTEEVLIRREVEALLARSQEAERARAALMEALTAQDFIAVAYLRGPRFVIDLANPRYVQLVGRDVVGQPLVEALPEIAAQGFETMLHQVVRTGEPCLVEEMPVRLARRGDGELHEVLCSFIYQPVRAPDGQVDGVLVLVLDVTEAVRVRQSAQRRMEEERMRRDFEQQLIGIVSHDLRNPLGAILLGTQLLLRRKDLDTRAVQSAERIRGSAERAMRLVRDLLDFTQARLGSGLKLKRERGDLHQVALEAVEELRAAYPERELHLEPAGDARGLWDSDRFAQVVDNLVGNALKYSPPDSPVHVRLEGAAHEVRMEVHNGGPPIDPEAMPRLFEPLQRAVSTADTASRSVGLGLYIVDQIVRAHGGRILVTSTRETGTTFDVRLPRQEA